MNVNDERVKRERVLLGLGATPTKDSSWRPYSGDLCWWMQYARDQFSVPWTNIDWYLVRVIRTHHPTLWAEVTFLDDVPRPGYRAGDVASVHDAMLWPVGTLTEK